MVGYGAVALHEYVLHDVALVAVADGTALVAQIVEEAPGHAVAPMAGCIDGAIAAVLAQGRHGLVLGQKLIDDILAGVDGVGALGVEAAQLHKPGLATATRTDEHDALA